MAENLQAPRGTQDLLPETSRIFRHINNTAYELAERYGYGEIQTPIFESTQVFSRTLGDSSDVVNKEMYTFQDRGGDALSLRPEGTAGIARAFISNGLAQHLPLKYYYFGPMFRYERPQKGRYRQFHQLGVECLGFESPLADVECISLGQRLLEKLGLADKVILELNTLGDQASRASYRESLVSYFEKYKSDLSTDSLTRLEKNPLRILDSKDAKDKEIVAQAPKMKDSLNKESQQFFSSVLEGLSHLGVPFKVNDHLVRGLDYYCHTVFEFTTTHLGAQGTVLAGGRYDGLIQLMGGPATPSVGWAAGVERLSLLIDENGLPKGKKIALIFAEESAVGEVMKLAHELRHLGYSVEVPMSGNVGKKFKRADKVGANFALVIGSSELANNTITFKDLKLGEQKILRRDELLEYLK